MVRICGIPRAIPAANVCNDDAFVALIGNIDRVAGVLQLTVLRQIQIDRGAYSGVNQILAVGIVIVSATRG